MRTPLLLLAAAALATGLALRPRAHAEEPPRPSGPRVQTRVVETKDGDVTLKGLLAYDPTISATRPVVLVIHDWWGQGRLARETAERLVSWGYVGFALDMYGDAKLVSTPAEAGALSKACGADGAAVGRRRARLQLDALKAFPFIDASRAATLGFCFGGTMSLELAYSGAPIRGAVSFHGHPTTPREGERSTAELLVLHGADDPFVPAAMLAAFQQRMAADKSPYELVQYSGAVHSFTDPGVDAHGLDGARYDARAAERAFERCRAFLGTLLAR